MLHTFLTQGVLKQLVNSFNVAADGIFQKILKICYFNAEEAIDIIIHIIIMHI